MNLNKFYSTDKDGFKAINNTKKKVLLIEDDEFCAYTVLRLMKNDFEIVHKFLGLEGIEEAKNNQYDIILLDIGLKDINGVEVLNSIKSIPNYKDIPVIAVTAFAMLGDKEKFIAAGFSYYIAKPYLIKDFKDLMFEALKNSK